MIRPGFFVCIRIHSMVISISKGAGPGDFPRGHSPGGSSERLSQPPCLPKPQIPPPQNLKFSKKIRYESRKQLAQQRPRIKGQFVKHPHHPDKGAGDLDCMVDNQGAGHEARVTEHEAGDGQAGQFEVSFVL